MVVSLAGVRGVEKGGVKRGRAQNSAGASGGKGEPRMQQALQFSQLRAAG
ncbi:MAG: hypothetical protein WCE61_23400 [Candidatus Acidiferrum sp.]